MAVAHIEVQGVHKVQKHFDWLSPSANSVCIVPYFLILCLSVWGLLGAIHFILAAWISKYAFKLFNAIMLQTSVQQRLLYVSSRNNEASTTTHSTLQQF